MIGCLREPVTSSHLGGRRGRVGNKDRHRHTTKSEDRIERITRGRWHMEITVKKSTLRLYMS